jgi:hypothetical protein
MPTLAQLAQRAKDFVYGHGVDVVGVFDAGFNQLFADGRPIKANVKEASKIADHPVEDGTTISDHQVMMPVEIELTLILGSKGEYRDTYNEIRALFRATELLTVQTRTGTYANMVIEAMPHDETADVFDAIPLVVKLREVQLVTAQFQALPPKAVAKKRDASTLKRGEQKTKTETATQTGGATKSSTLYRILYGKN